MTDLLNAWSEGTPEDGEALFQEIYSDLHHLAGGLLWSERRHHTLQQTALLHEAFVRLAKRRSTRWVDRRHFFATAAQAMRRVLIDHARRRACLKRKADQPQPTTAPMLETTTRRDRHLIALGDALRDLRRVDPFKAQLVDLRFFAGFSIPETAGILGCSRATVERHWQLAQGWLYRELAQAPPH